MFVYRFPKIEGKDTLFVRSTAVDFYLNDNLDNYDNFIAVIYRI